jgi:hypothetical protein
MREQAAEGIPDSQHGEINSVLGEKPLNATVIRRGLDAAFRGHGQSPQVGRGPLEQGDGKPGHKLQPGAVPAEMIGKNVRNRMHVPHTERV